MLMGFADDNYHNLNINNQNITAHIKVSLHENVYCLFLTFLFSVHNPQENKICNIMHYIKK